MATKVLFIGLDSGEASLIERWSDAGVLPAIQSLRARGLTGPVTVPPGFSNGAMWPSLFTGVNPGRHGRYFRYPLAPESYDRSRFDVDTDFREPPFWTALSGAGRRVAVIDMLLAPLTHGLNGIQLADWTTHDRSGEPRSWPASLLAEATARFGEDPLEGYSDLRYETLGPARMREQMLDRIRRKTDLSLHYLAQESWDLFMTVFGEPHDVGHLCWHLHDPTHPQHDPEYRRQLGDPIEDTYAAVDAAIAALVAAAGPEATVIVFSGPGMGPNYSGSFLLSELLRRLDSPNPTLGSMLAGAARSAYRTLLPAAIRERVLSTAVKPMAQRAYMSELASRRYFALPNSDNAGAIRINVRGREPYGQVAPGREFRELCDALEVDLKAIVNLDTGRPAVKRVLRVADLYHGDCVQQLPDLLVEWNREAPIMRLGSPKAGTLGDGRRRALRTGDHTHRACLAMAGPTTALQRLTTPIAIEDIAPTIGALLGVPLPGLDGAPIGRSWPEGGPRRERPGPGARLATAQSRG